MENETRERGMEAGEEFILIVRKTIMKMYGEKIHLTLDSLLHKLKEKVSTRNSFWKWERTTLYRFMTSKIGYSYTKTRSYYEDLKEDVTIADQRIRYIKSVQKYRNAGRLIFYQDETWVNKNMTPAKAWLDKNCKGGLKPTQGKGERSIVCHIGSQKGFLKEACLIFRGKKALKDSDYHSEMNSNVFLDWMEKKFLVTFLQDLWL